MRVIGGISAHLDDCAVSWLPGRSVIHVSRMYLNSSTQPAKAAKKAIAKAPKAKAKAPKAKAKGPLPLAPIGSYRDGSPQVLTPRSAKGKDKARKAIFQDSSDDEAATTAKQRARWRQEGFST